LIVTMKVNGQKAVKVDGINRRMQAGEIILYTPEYGKTTKTDKCNEAAIMRGRVASLRTTGDMVIPRTGFVLSWQGRYELNNLKFWDKIELSFSFNSSRSDIVHAIGGGPRLVRNGRLFITSDMERFRKDVTVGRAPRSAVGITSSGKLLLVTVDGRQPGKSVGMTLEELGKLMLELGAVEAMNLDGGGSTTMVIGGKVVNYPSAGEERKISSALLVFHQDYRRK